VSDSAQDRLAWIESRLEVLEHEGLRRRLVARDGQAGVTAVIDGRELLNFGSNDYLNLAGNVRLAEAVARAVREEGWGSGASPLVTGRSRLHRQLEERLAQFEGCQAALLFASGFAANAGTVPALVGRGDAVYSDAANHASIVDGCRLSRAHVHVYPHVDCDALEAMLREHAGHGGRRLIVTDGLFSMDGNLAPLVRLAELADEFQCMLMVDEAHATGVFGPGGRGVSEYLGVEDRVDVRIGTLSKALGCHGGFVAGSGQLVDWLANRARSYVFSTAPPAATCAAALTALEIVQSEPERRQTLLARAAELREQLRDQGWQVGRSESQIIPLVAGTAQRTMELSAALRERGLLVPGIRPPTVPEGQSRLRISLSCGHTLEMIARLVEVLGELKCEIRSTKSETIGSTNPTNRHE